MVNLFKGRHRASHVRTLGIAITLTALGCGGERTSTREGTETWIIDSIPVLSIGRDESDNLDAAFERITGATRLDDGSILVADLGAAPLKLFSADGAFIRRIAREGKGPGEITYLARLYRCGGEVYTYDIDGFRTSAWSLGGTYLREFRFQVPALQQTPYISACNANGRFVHLGWATNLGAFAGYHRDTVPAWISESVDGAPTVIDTIAGSERWGRTIDGRVVGTRPLPYAKQPYVGIGLDRIYIATGDSDGVRVYTLDGAALPRIPFTDSAPTVTAQDIRNVVEREVLDDGEQRRGSIEREYAEVTFPQSKSPLSALVVDSDGMLWLRSAEVAGQTSARWRVYGADGRLRATIALPTALEVFEIGGDYVLGRELDPVAGVPLLKQYRLSRLGVSAP